MKDFLKAVREHKGKFVLITIFVTAIIIRVINFVLLSKNPFFYHQLVDSNTYDEIAKMFLYYDSYPEAFYQPPFYPVFLSVIYKLFGLGYIWPRILQTVIGLFNIYLVYYLASRIFNRKTGLLAAFMISVYGVLIYFELELLPAILIAFLNLLFLIALYRTITKPSYSKAFVSGILFGLSAITMPVILPFAIIAVVYFFITSSKRKDSNHSTALIILLAVLGALIPILPVTYHNYQKSRELIVISYNGGINFYLGTGKNFEEKVNIRPGYYWEELTNEPAKYGITKPNETSGYFYQKSFKIIQDDPMGYLNTLAKKLLMFANGNEIMRNQEIYPFRQYSPVLRVLLWKNRLAFPYGILFPLFLIGFILCIIDKRRTSYLLLLFCLLHILVLLSFFITSRYRVNIIPVMIIIGAYGIASLIEKIKQKEFAKVSVLALIFLGLIILSNWKIGDMPVRFNADAYYNLAISYRDENNASQGKEMLLKALEIDPDHTEACNEMGILLMSEGDFYGAKKYQERIVKLHQDYYPGLVNLSANSCNLEEYGPARQYLLAASKMVPPANQELSEKLSRNLQLLNNEAELSQTASSSGPKIRDGRRKLEKDPYNLELILKIAGWYKSLNYPSLAEKYYQRASYITNHHLK
jgi:4-amino-4-deoxy-L-arabinose transferase-like glycosyltransferase